MARLIFLTTSTAGLGHLFTIHSAVGKHGANHRKDVLLVQFFLRALIPTPPGAPPIPLDGNCDWQTIKWIRYFQTAYGSGGSGVREAGQRGGGQISDGSVRSAGGGSSPTTSITDGTSNTITFGEATGPSTVQTIQDGSSNTIVIGEQPPAGAGPHVHRHYGTIRPPEDGAPFETDMTLVRLNRAYRDNFGPDRFRRIDLDPAFPRDLFTALYGVVCGQ